MAAKNRAHVLRNVRERTRGRSLEKGADHAREVYAASEGRGQQLMPAAARRNDDEFQQFRRQAEELMHNDK
jgi:hypothetical protein